MRVLVTGGAGFIGSHFAERLLAAGEEVVVLDKLTYAGNEANVPDGAEFHRGDIGVKEDMLPGFAAKAFAIKRLMRVNPRMPQNEGEILEIYRAAW